jgi:hypothetical protein
MANSTTPQRSWNPFQWISNPQLAKVAIFGTALTVLAVDLLDEPSLLYGVCEHYNPEHAAFIDGVEYSEVPDLPANIPRLPRRSRQARIIDFYLNLGIVLRKPETFRDRKDEIDIDVELEDLDEDGLPILKRRRSIGPHQNDA